MTIAQMLTRDGGAPEASTTRFVDRHNGWGLSALHIAVFQGSVQTGVGGGPFDAALREISD